MTRFLPLAAAVLVTACAQPGTRSSENEDRMRALVSITEGGELVEVERQAEYSIIQVRSTPPGSVASSMYVLRGACAVARARGKRLFSSASEPATVRSYRLTFPNSATDAELRGSTKSVFSLSECESLRF